MSSLESVFKLGRLSIDRQLGQAENILRALETTAGFRNEAELAELRARAICRVDENKAAVASIVRRREELKAQALGRRIDPNQTKYRGRQILDFGGNLIPLQVYRDLDQSRNRPVPEKLQECAVQTDAPLEIQRQVGEKDASFYKIMEKQLESQYAMNGKQLEDRCRTAGRQRQDAMLQLRGLQQQRQTLLQRKAHHLRRIKQLKLLSP